MAFYSNLRNPVVTVSPVVPNQEMTVILDPKAGILDASDVVDAVTGATLQATVKLWRLDSGYWMSKSGTFKGILVPPDTAVAVEVSATGYATWYYPGFADVSRRRNHQPSVGPEDDDFHCTAVCGEVNRSRGRGCRTATRLKRAAALLACLLSASGGAHAQAYIDLTTEFAQPSGSPGFGPGVGSGAHAAGTALPIEVTLQDFLFHSYRAFRTGDGSASISFQ